MCKATKTAEIFFFILAYHVKKKWFNWGFQRRTDSSGGWRKIIRKCYPQTPSSTYDKLKKTKTAGFLTKQEFKSPVFNFLLIPRIMEKCSSPAISKATQQQQKKKHSKVIQSGFSELRLLLKMHQHNLDINNTMFTT